MKSNDTLPHYPESSRLPELETRVLHAQELLQGKSEVMIYHNGQWYRLRLTRQNKLILNK